MVHACRSRPSQQRPSNFSAELRCGPGHRAPGYRQVKRGRLKCAPGIARPGHGVRGFGFTPETVVRRARPRWWRATRLCCTRFGSFASCSFGNLRHLGLIRGRREICCHWVLTSRPALQPASRFASGCSPPSSAATAPRPPVTSASFPQPRSSWHPGGHTPRLAWCGTGPPNPARRQKARAWAAGGARH